MKDMSVYNTTNYGAASLCIYYADVTSSCTLQAVECGGRAR